jgi:hypothetical protein
MSEFEDLERDAEDLAKKDPQLADEGLQQVENFAEQETGHRFDQQISEGVDQVEQQYGGDQNQSNQ